MPQRYISRWACGNFQSVVCCWLSFGNRCLFEDWSCSRNKVTQFSWFHHQWWRSCNNCISFSNQQGLDISITQVTRSGLMSILSILSCLCALRYLNVSINSTLNVSSSLGDLLTPSILSLARSVHNLQLLSITGTRLSECCVDLEKNPFLFVCFLRLISIGRLFRKIAPMNPKRRCCYPQCRQRMLHSRRIRLFHSSSQ